jgi:hypothetical protein
MKIIIVH